MESSSRQGWASLSGSFSASRLLAFWLVASLLIRTGMCFGVGDGSKSDYYHQYNDRLEIGSRSAGMPIMPMDNMMEPQALRADRMMLRLIMDATTPSSSVHRNNNWRSAMNSQNRNMWERLGWGW